MIKTSTDKPRMTIEVVFFAPTEGLSDADAESAREANRANLHLGLAETRPINALRMIDLPLDGEWENIRLAANQWLHNCFWFASIEAYPDHNANFYIRMREGDTKSIGFIRVRTIASKGSAK